MVGPGINPPWIQGIAEVLVESKAIHGFLTVQRLVLLTSIFFKGQLYYLKGIQHRYPSI